MIVTKRLRSIAELNEFLNGTVVGTGDSGSNSANSKTFTDSGEDFGSTGLAVVAGDLLHLFGVGIFVVASTPSPGDDALSLVTNIVDSSSAQGYQILRNGVGTAQFYDLHSTADGGFTLLYDPFAAQHSSGFMCNEAAVTGLPSGSYSLSKKVTLSGSGTLVDSGASEPHDQIKISHIEMSFSSAGSVTGVEFTLTWDADGDVVALGPTTSVVSPFTALTTANVVSLSASFGEQVIDFRNSAAASNKKLYLHIKLTGGTGNLDTARLYWFV